MAQVQSAYRLELVPAASCTLRWVCTLTGYARNATRTAASTKATYETTTSTSTRILSNQPLPDEELNLSSFQIEPIAVLGGASDITVTLQMGEIDPANPAGASLSTKTLDVVAIPVGSCLQLDAGAGGWRIVTKTTSYPLV